MYLRAYRTPHELRRVEGMTREEVCERYKRKILTLARRVCEQQGDDGTFTPEDLVGYGAIGLLEAFDRFDASHRVDFASFASYRILGQMLDAVRADGGTTRRQRQIVKEIAKAKAKAKERLGREPNHAEIADQLGVDVDAYWKMNNQALLSERVPMSPAPDDDDFGGEMPALAQEPLAPRAMLAHDARAALREAIARLPERERQVILLYYARDLSLAEIGAVLEVTPSRVCQILGDARTRLRKAIGRDLDLDLFSVDGAA